MHKFLPLTVCPGSLHCAQGSETGSVSPQSGSPKNIGNGVFNQVIHIIHIFGPRFKCFPQKNNRNVCFVNSDKVLKRKLFLKIPLDKGIVNKLAESTEQ
jgi:hypothetical protein